jgi:hypothetical protein
MPTLKRKPAPELATGRRTGVCLRYQTDYAYDALPMMPDANMLWKSPTKLLSIRPLFIKEIAWMSFGIRHLVAQLCTGYGAGSRQQFDACPVSRRAKGMAPAAPDD